MPGRWEPRDQIHDVICLQARDEKRWRHELLGPLIQGKLSKKCLRISCTGLIHYPLRRYKRKQNIEKRRGKKGINYHFSLDWRRATPEWHGKLNWSVTKMSQEHPETTMQTAKEQSTQARINSSLTKTLMYDSQYIGKESQDHLQLL